jgi:hypothetical protein
MHRAAEKREGPCDSSDLDVPQLRQGSFTRIGNVASAPLMNIITNRTSFRRALAILPSASTTLAEGSREVPTGQ